jgi:hypothetical protein
MLRPASAGVLAVALLLTAIAPSCTHEGAIRDATAEATASVVGRLAGRWTLMSYQPDVALEPNLQLLLNGQFGRLVVAFSGTTLQAQGPGVAFSRTFKVEDVYGDHFKATVYDSSGIGIDSVCDFSGTTLTVRGVTSPWRGTSTFRRAP